MLSVESKTIQATLDPTGLPAPGSLATARDKRDKRFMRLWRLE